MKGITHEKSVPYSAESNGKGERVTKNLNDIARTMLLELRGARGYEKLWAEAVNTANHLRSRMFTHCNNANGETPYEWVVKRGLHLSHIRTFGCKAFLHAPKIKRKSKHEARAKIGLLVG